ncbi:hypothetical protein RDI58_024775 [Solanum bulbocastanum]|uniref:Uncharacterized protein n=1 Tax=Solanum bulbocastanum TaxID=147425 RepID=A0AAN8T2K6_SOLBU
MDILMLWGDVPLPAIMPPTETKGDGPSGTVRLSIVDGSKQVNPKALAELQSIEESIVHVILERPRLETFEISISKVYDEYSSVQHLQFSERSSTWT